MPADRDGGTGTLRRWLRLAGLAFVLFVLPMLLVWPLASFLVEQAAELGSVSPAAAFALVVGLLGLDAVAMIPHGLIGALAGTALSWPLAAFATWCGIMLASCINYAIGRFAGRPLARRVVGEADLAAAEARAGSLSGLILFGTRPVPVVGEVVLVAAGIARFPFRRFLLSVGLANALLAPLYAGLPVLLDDADPERLLTVATLGIPLLSLAAYGVVRLVRRQIDAGQ